MNGEMGRIGIFFTLFIQMNHLHQRLHSASSRDQSGDVKDLV